jgi:thioesterase domain-containing protein
LGSDQPFYGLDVYALQEQRLSEGHELFTDVEAIAAYFVDEIQTVQPAGPYYLGGGCEGGVVAFEVARQLQARGERVGLLALWETPRTGFFRRKPLYAFFALARPLRYLLRHGPKKLLAAALQRTRRAEPTEAGSDGDQAARNLRIRRAIGQATRSHAPQVFRGKITFLQAREQRAEFYEPSDGWDELATEGIELHVLRGDHTSYFEEHVLDFAEWLKGRLDDVQKVARNA